MYDTSPHVHHYEWHFDDLFLVGFAYRLFQNAILII